MLGEVRRALHVAGMLDPLHPAVEQDHDKKLSRTDEHVGRLHDAPERTLRHLKPVWRCVADSRWELTFYAVEYMESANGVQKQTHRRTTGIVVDGLAST